MLNTEHFVRLAGHPVKFDQEMEELHVQLTEAKKNGVKNPLNDLCSLQVRQHAAGYRCAELVESIYGWYVRDGMGFSGWEILASVGMIGGNGSRNAAIAWGTKWANEDPEHREFYVRKAYLAKEDEWNR